jgi:hypothetical protein
MRLMMPSGLFAHPSTMFAACEEGPWSKPFVTEAAAPPPWFAAQLPSR